MYSFNASPTIWNPLKGFVPYYYGTNSQPAVNFPHSMENQYFPMKDLILGSNSFDFSSIDAILMNVASNRYDGDIRIGFWQIGFLGHCGEWHTSPNITYFASSYHQNQVLSAFNSSFVQTKIQLRYFDVTGNSNAQSWNVGFHDDSFFQDTYGEAWMFYNTSVTVGATNQWRNQPIGGEVRPELWPCVFSSDPATDCQAITTVVPLNWTDCVQLTHSSYQWLSYAFTSPGYSGADYGRAIYGSIMQRYSFFVSQITANEMNCSGT
ncbi:unnamed protein product [Rotaria magnacalcarata]|uniref:Uncharacterized protein n=1 Tax=Rotaria magnacalcarata TaxID=392030 RepID=A0A816TAV9_9BILA|nr:unnamed protein product [Rotaria magnacalcarata]